MGAWREISSSDSEDEREARLLFTPWYPRFSLIFPPGTDSGSGCLHPLREGHLRWHWYLGLTWLVAHLLTPISHLLPYHPRSRFLASLLEWSFRIHEWLQLAFKHELQSHQVQCQTLMFIISCCPHWAEVVGWTHPCWRCEGYLVTKPIWFSICLLAWNRPQGWTILKTTLLAILLFKMCCFSIFLGATRREILLHGGFWSKTCQSHPSHWALISIVFPTACSEWK